MTPEELARVIWDALSESDPEAWLDPFDSADDRLQIDGSFDLVAVARAVLATQQAVQAARQSQTTGAR